MTRSFGRLNHPPSRLCGSREQSLCAFPLLSKNMAEAQGTGLLEQLQGCLPWSWTSLGTLWVFGGLFLVYTLKVPLRLQDNLSTGEPSKKRKKNAPHLSNYARSAPNFGQLWGTPKHPKRREIRLPPPHRGTHGRLPLEPLLSQPLKPSPSQGGKTLSSSCGTLLRVHNLPPLLTGSDPHFSSCCFPVTRSRLEGVGKNWGGGSLAAILSPLPWE